MRKRSLKSKSNSGKSLPTAAIIAICFAAYLLVLALGIAFMILVPYLQGQKRLIEFAKSRGEYTITHFTEYTESTLGTEYYLYSEYGSLVTTDQPHLAAMASAELKPLVPRLLATGEMYRLNILHDQSASRLCILCAKTVYAPSGTRFVSFIIQDLSHVNVSAATFAGIFTLIFITAVVLIRYISRQQSELMSLQRDLISNVSHELKTPITSIRAMGELLYDGMYRTEEDRKRYSSIILSESERLSQLVREIIRLSQLQSNKVKFDKAHCHADGIFTPVIDHYLMVCPDIGFEMDVSGLDLKSIPVLYTDGQQIETVWRIIIDNAIKFAGKGGRVKITQQIGNEYVTFRFADNGPGIPKEDINKIFDRFYKSDVAHNSQGSGLGLAIAREIVRGLGEKIWVTSEEGKGSSFYLTVSYK